MELNWVVSFGLLLLCGLIANGETLFEDPSTYSVRFIAPKKIETQQSNLGITCQLLSFGETQLHKSLQRGRELVIESRPLTHEIDHEHEETEDDLYIFEVFSYNQELLAKFVTSVCGTVDQSHVVHAKDDSLPEADEVIPIVHNGSPSNRIDLVMMGDGYTADQRTQFIDDISRLVKEMFQDITFKSYLPVFNIWALYRASVQSGIGSGGVPKNTAFGLYRDGTELRGIYCSKASTARSACAATGFCDFPTLIGNDPYYGGLGGEFTISTSSVTSGTVVLRHEMGHNFGQVGEEYDGGTAYFGANYSPSVAALQWTAWLTNSSNRVAEQSIQRVQSYAWYDLGSGPFTITFTSDGTYSKAYLIFSASGCDVAGAIKITIDGKDIGWTPYMEGDLDRFFYPYIWDTGFTAGTHTLVFTQVIPPASGAPIRQLCNVNMHEYKAEPLFHFENSYIGAYPTWNSAGKVSYRPDNELCLMRNMSSAVFCPVCQETIWIQFLKRISLIDNITVSDVGNTVSVSLALLPVAHLRPVPVPGEAYITYWYLNNNLVNSLTNTTEWTQPKASSTGTWDLFVQFVTPEVRSDPTGLLTAKKSFII